jgi:hypothetical protein
MVPNIKKLLINAITEPIYRKIFQVNLRNILLSQPLIFVFYKM